YVEADALAGRAGAPYFFRVDEPEVHLDGVAEAGARGLVGVARAADRADLQLAGAVDVAGTAGARDSIEPAIQSHAQLGFRDYGPDASLQGPVAGTQFT